MSENLKRSQEICNQKEQALRQSMMVLKFREEALRKIEKSQKEKLDLTVDDKDEIIVSFKCLILVYSSWLYLLSSNLFY